MMTKEDKRDLLLLGLLTVLLAFWNDQWVRLEPRPPHWDMGRHLWTSLIYLDKAHDLRHIYRLWTDYYFYPPFRHWVALPFYFLFGKSLPSAVDSNIVFIAVMAFSLYGIGRLLWGRLTGLLAAVFALASPYYVSQFKEYMMDAPLGAMVSLGLFLLIWAGDFADRRRSWLLGLGMGLGMLTKWNYAPSLAVPLLVRLYQAWTLDRPGPEKKEARRNILLCLAVASAVSLLWYPNHPRMLKEDLVTSSLHTGKPDFFTWGAQTYYLGVLEQYQLYGLPFLLFAGGFLWSLLSSRAREKNGILLLFLAGHYFLFNLIHPDPRYSMPLMAGISVIAVSWIGELGPGLTRTLVAGMVFLYCVFAFTAISFGSSWVPASLSAGPFVVFAQHGCMLGAPSREQWHQEEAVDFLAAQPGPKDMTFKGMDTTYFNYWGLYYYCRRDGVDYQQFKEGTTYLLWREKVPPPVPSGYGLLREYGLPDKSVLRIFKKS